MDIDHGECRHVLDPQHRVGIVRQANDADERMNRVYMYNVPNDADERMNREVHPSKQR